MATYILVRYFHFKKTEYADQGFGMKTQRITTLLIIIFLIPSIWSAVLLVKQNNFDKKATEFVDAHRSLGSSLIYDYKIEHHDGSVLKIFMTEETLTEKARAHSFTCAKDFGINEDQLVVKEYITKNVQENDSYFKDIYERLDNEIEKYEMTIGKLTEELQDAKKNELPYMQLANEISATYPDIKSLYLGQGLHVSLDSLKSSSCIMVKVETNSPMDSTVLEQLKKWIQIRLQVENVQIDNIAR
jgi:predicted ribosome quality control (RQC) complex YloA/Tae2 family protein